MEDIRYSELQFLQGLANHSIQLFSHYDEKQKPIASKIPALYTDMLITLVEDYYVQFENQDMQFLAARLRGEMRADNNLRARFQHLHWENPRGALEDVLSLNSLQGIRITYRGLRRI